MENTTERSEHETSLWQNSDISVNERGNMKDITFKPPMFTLRGFCFSLVISLIILCLILLEGVVWAWPLQIVRAILGIIFVLYIPGYCLTIALFPRDSDLTILVRSAFSIGLSIAITPLLAITLNYLPWGIRLWPVLIGLYIVIILAILVALWRRTFLSPDRIYPHKRKKSPSNWLWLQSLEYRRLYMVLGIALFVVILSSIGVLAASSSGDLTTEFYILGQGRLAEYYPVEFLPGGEVSVFSGIVNREGIIQVYHTEVNVVDATSGYRQILVRNKPITLAPDEEKQQYITWKMPDIQGQQDIELLLFKGDDQTPYRQLFLRLQTP